MLKQKEKKERKKKIKWCWEAAVLINHHYSLNDQETMDIGHVGATLVYLITPSSTAGN